MKYQVGDLLKVKSIKTNSYAYCVITEYRDQDVVNVFWIVENEHIKNNPIYRSWSYSVLDSDFVRLA
jgi:hypothetical protein